MKSVLIATIGTRDLMYRVQSGEWYNAGDDRMQDGEIIGEQAEVLSDFGQGSLTYRDLTCYLLQNYETYQERIKPVILGGLLEEKIDEIEKIYLIGTDQDLSISYSKRDTIHSCELIKLWLQKLKPKLEIEIILLGPDGTNPSDFESMFQWWSRLWQNIIKIQKNQPIWMCLKGGVGQASESGRISALSRFTEQIQFFDFDEIPTNNRNGIPSNYRGPVKGRNYLWDRTRQQALQSLSRFDYSNLKDLLSPYLSEPQFNGLETLIDAGIAWNKGQFEDFLKDAKTALSLQQKQQTESFWWMAYEEMYLAVVRLEQENTVEAFLHSFRSLEALTVTWIRHYYPKIVSEPEVGFIQLKKNETCSSFKDNPKLRELRELFKDCRDDSIDLHNHARRTLLTVADFRFKSDDIEPLWTTAKDVRNRLSHNIEGLDTERLFTAWKTSNREKWEERMLECLNLLSEQRFTSLWQPSLFASIHHRIKQKLEQAI